MRNDELSKFYVLEEVRESAPRESIYSKINNVAFGVPILEHKLREIEPRAILPHNGTMTIQ